MQGPSVVWSQMRLGHFANLGATRTDLADLQVPGMTPNPQSGRVHLEGRRPDGATLQEQAGFFAKGLRVYQATVLGKKVPLDAADAFFGGLRLPT